MSITASRTDDPVWMSRHDFRAFQAGRPDNERWELVDGMPVMMTPPFIDHNRIAGNIERLLNDALLTHDPSRMAVQRPGVELGLDAQGLAGLGLGARYAPEPDVAVIDDDPRPDRRFADRAFVLVEVVSSTDDDTTLAGGRPWIEAKSELYRSHAPCEAVVLIEQRRIEVRLSLRTAGGWLNHVLRSPTDRLVLPTCGLSCEVNACYAGTYLSPRSARTQR